MLVCEQLTGIEQIRERLGRGPSRHSSLLFQIPGGSRSLGSLSQQQPVLVSVANNANIAASIGFTSPRRMVRANARLEWIEQGCHSMAGAFDGHAKKFRRRSRKFAFCRGPRATATSSLSTSATKAPHHSAPLSLSATLLRRFMPCPEAGGTRPRRRPPPA
jgi:hypothetical protein